MLVKRVKDTVKSFLGQKSGLPIESYGFNAAESVVNFVLKEGQLRRINGGTVYANVIAGQNGGITSLHRFKNLLVAQRGTTVAVEDAESSATFTDIFTGTDTNKFYTSQWRDRLFLTNKVDLKFLLNRTDNELDPVRKSGVIGVDAPDFLGATNFGTTTTPGGTGTVDAAPFLIEIDGNGSVEKDLFQNYIMTFFDSETNSESPGWGSQISVDGISELFFTGPASAASLFPQNLGPKAYSISFGAAAGDQIVNLKYSGLSSFLAAQKAKYPRITHFRFYRYASSTVIPSDWSLSDFRAVPLKNGGSFDSRSIIEIDTFISEGLDFVDNTGYGSLELVTPPENNQLPPTDDRYEKLYYQLYYGCGRRINGVDVLTPTDPDYDLFQIIYGEYNFNADDFKTFKQSKFFRDQLFAVGSVSKGINLEASPLVVFGDGIDLTGNQFSEANLLHGSEVYQPDYYPYVWEVGRGDGQISTGIGVLGDTALLLFKEKSTYYLSGSSPSDYVVRILDTNKGCVNQSTIQETPAGVICLDRSGFVLFSRIGLGQKISTDIQDIIDSILFQYSDSFYSWYDPKDQRYCCSVVLPGATTPNYTLIFDIQSGEWTISSGLEGLSRIADTDSNGEFVDTLGAKSTGRLTDLSNQEAVKFVDSPVYSSWTSGPIDFGDDQHKKKIRWLYIRAKCAGTWTVTIEIIPDYDESRKYVLEDYNVVASQSTWYSSDIATDGNLLWDDGTWATSGLQRKIAKIPLVSRGYTFQVRIINKSVDESAWGFTIEGVSVEAEMLNK